jgi:DinB family protein
MNAPNRPAVNDLRNPADRFVARLEYVAMRLGPLAGDNAAPGLTDPDPKTGERWDWGQVWAHLAEFISYWVRQVRLVLATQGPEPVPFGRIKSDPERVAAIEKDRHRSPSELMKRLNGQLADLRQLLDDVPREHWGKQGIHQTLGVMDVEHIVDEFLVGHLEEHEAQLNQLSAADDTKSDERNEVTT